MTNFFRAVGAFFLAIWLFFWTRRVWVIVLVAVVGISLAVINDVGGLTTKAFAWLTKSSSTSVATTSTAPALGGKLNVVPLAGPIADAKAEAAAANARAAALEKELTAYKANPPVPVITPEAVQLLQNEIDRRVNDRLKGTSTVPPANTGTQTTRNIVTPPVDDTLYTSPNGGRDPNIISAADRYPPGSADGCAPGFRVVNGRPGCQPYTTGGPAPAVYQGQSGNPVTTWQENSHLKDLPPGTPKWKCNSSRMPVAETTPLGPTVGYCVGAKPH